MTARGTSTRKPRADAELNTLRIVAAARSTFAEGGLELPMRMVARRAGVGVATLYRHFPTRTDLIHAVLQEQVTACSAQLQRSLDDPDPWRALSDVVRFFAARQVADRGLNEALLGSHEAGHVFAAERREHARGFELLVERAHRAEVIRNDVSVEDIRTGLRAIAGFRSYPPERAEDAMQRLCVVLLAGIRRT